MNTLYKKTFIFLLISSCLLGGGSNVFSQEAPKPVSLSVEVPNLIIREGEEISINVYLHFDDGSLRDITDPSQSQGTFYVVQTVVGGKHLSLDPQRPGVVKAISSITRDRLSTPQILSIYYFGSSNMELRKLYEQAGRREIKLTKDQIKMVKKVDEEGLLFYKHIMFNIIPRDALDVYAEKTELKVGDTVQLRVFRILGDGSKVDITSKDSGTTYSSSYGSVASVSDDGLVTIFPLPKNRKYEISIITINDGDRGVVGLTISPN